MQNPIDLGHRWDTGSLAIGDDDRVCALGLLTMPLGDGTVLVYARADRSVHVLSAPEASVLGGCTRFATLSEHAKGGAAERFLQGCRERGLLTSHAELVQEVVRGIRGNEPPARVDCLAVVTKDRVDAVERCLGSHLSVQRERGMTRRLAVMDDSEAAGVRDRTRAVLAVLEHRFGVTIGYGGLDEKRRFRDALVEESGASPAIVDFALFGAPECAFRAGANRNALLLATGGDVVLSVDDDTSARIATIDKPRPGIALGSCDPRAIWFFPDHAAALAAADFLDRDLTDVHEELLGREIGECLLGQDVDFDQLTYGLADRARRGGRVRVTQAGILGDSGMSSPSNYLWLEGASRDRLLASEEVYRAAYRSRQAVMVAPRKTVTDFPLCVSTTLGFDNRQILPPFVPVTRGEDTLFGLTLGRCIGNAYFGHVPAAVLHQPVEARAFTTEAIWRDAGRVPFKLILASCVATAPLGPDRDDASRIRTLGRYLVEVASLPVPEFLELVRVGLWREAAAMMRTIDQRLGVTSGSPAFWATDVARYLDTLRTALQHPDYAAPYDLGVTDDPAEARRRCQSIVRAFGALLIEWPALVSASARLRARGLSLIDEQQRARS